MHPPRCPYRGNASALRASTGVHNNLQKDWWHVHLSELRIGKFMYEFHCHSRFSSFSVYTPNRLSKHRFVMIDQV